MRRAVCFGWRLKPWNRNPHLSPDEYPDFTSIKEGCMMDTAAEQIDRVRAASVESNARRRLAQTAYHAVRAVECSLSDGRVVLRGKCHPITTSNSPKKVFASPPTET